MSNVTIKNVDKAFGNICETCEEAVKLTLKIFYPRAGLVTRKTRNEKASVYRKVRRSAPGTPYKVQEYSYADPGNTKRLYMAKHGLIPKITETGVDYDYYLFRKDTESRGSVWANTMEHGGQGLPGLALVNRIAIQFIESVRKRPKKKWKLNNK